MKGDILDRPEQRQIVGIALISVGTLALLGTLHVISPAALRACSPLIVNFPPSTQEVW